MSFDINQIIRDDYPSLAERFAQQLPQVEFSHVVEQLSSAVNETEARRGLHRLHCLLKLWSGEITHDNLGFMAEIDETKKQALVALVLIDSCKCSASATTTFETLGYRPLKDSVIFFFDTLEKAPEIYPIFNQIPEAAQAYIKDNVFYLHQRHLLFGEVPVESLKSLENLLATEEIDQLKQRMELQNIFWIANLLGFDLPKKAEGQKAEDFGPTMSDDRLANFRKLQHHLMLCAEQKSLNDLSWGFYYDGIPQDALIKIQPYNDTVVRTFVSRFMMLLADNKNLDSQAITLELLTNHIDTIEAAAEAEAKCYQGTELLSATFLPAVYWSLVEINKSEKSPLEIVVLYLQFQKSFFESLLEHKEFIAEHKSIPLFSVKEDKTFLTNFSKHPDYQIRLSLDAGRFISVKPRLLAPAATNYPARAEAATSSDQVEETAEATKESSMTMGGV